VSTIGLFTRTFRTRGWPVWARYLCTAGIVLAALAVRLALQPVLPGYQFLLFFAAIITCAVLFDRGSGIVAVLLSAGLAAFFLIEPEWSFEIEETRHVYGLSLFIAIGLATAGIIEALHTAVKELADANERLAAADREKDLLLSEASHRMRNDLAIMASLFQVQQRNVQDETARAALAGMVDRLHVLGRVHERLRRSEETAVVNAQGFIDELCEDLRAALIGLRPIVLRVEAERHLLPQERAVAVGLVINELLTNALKYAFPDERAGNVTVRFRRDGEAFVLEVHDDGVGIATDRLAANAGLGQRLVKAMVAQLGGTYTIAPDEGAPGTRATVRFPAVPA
jgi:two-component system, sensor histidine kinase PdtaS